MNEPHAGDPTASRSVPSRGAAPCVGAWRRTSLSIAGRTLLEDGDVLWLQGERYFADLRTSSSPLTSTALYTAFSGQVSWNPPEISFHRDLDLTHEPVEDRAELVIDADDLIESGVVCHEGRRIPYVEKWTRSRGTHTMRRVLDGFDQRNRLSMRLVEIDGLAIVLLDERDEGGGFSACQFVRERNTWSEVRRVGAVSIAPPPRRSTFQDAGPYLTLPASCDRAWASRRWRMRELSCDADAR